MSRLEQLRRLLQDDPDDLFLNFGLAMELLGEGHPEEALGAFDRVLELDPGHTPGYQQKARALMQMGRRDQACRTLLDGIEAAERGGDTHAAEQMRNTLSAMKME